MAAHPGLQWLPNGLIKHDLPRPEGLIECDTALDIGAGVRPMQWYTPRRHICVEPYGPYADRLGSAGYEVLRKTALEALQTPRNGHAVYLLDVIEHMEKAGAQEVIELAKRGARQVVVYTPYGFMEQHHDAWGLGGDHWQLHRCGWHPEEFPGWWTKRYGQAPFEGFYAIWTASIPN